MIPTARKVPVQGRVGGWLRSAIAPAFVASGILHAVALSWGSASGLWAGPAGTTASPLQVRLAERKQAPEAAPIRHAPAPQAAGAPMVAAPAAIPAPETRRLTVPAVDGVSPLPIADAAVVPPLMAAPRETPMRPPVMAVADADPLQSSGGGTGSDSPGADYQALLRAAAERLQRYPERARRLGFEGTAVVAIELPADRVAPRVVLVRSSGIGMLDRAAIDLLDRAAREVDPVLAPDRSGQLRFPVRYALRDGRQ